MKGDKNMSEIENKILGKENSVNIKRIKKDVFTVNNIWVVSRQGCGSNLINGKILIK